MILTKYEHACFTVEKDGKLLVVDPGGFTTDLAALENVVAIVVTHEHADHFDVSALGAIVAHNPKVVIYAHENIIRQLGDVLPHKAVSVGETILVGPFNLEFFGGEHEIIHPDIPMIPNLGVMINSTVYYPGDSFVEPGRQVAVLALPVAAPWLKLSEVINFARNVQPTQIFPTHDAILSRNGLNLVDKIIPAHVDATYIRLNEPLEVNG